jgi:hypothetical protein
MVPSCPNNRRLTAVQYRILNATWRTLKVAYGLKVFALVCVECTFEFFFWVALFGREN